jgi:hypothetical protein
MRQEAGRMALESNALGLDERRAAIADRPALQARAEAEHQAKLDLVRAQTDHQRSGASKDDKQGRGFEIENMRKSALELAQRWGTVKTPQDVVPLYVQAVNDGLLTREQAEAEINKTPQDPAQFQAHAQAQFQQGMSFVQKTELALKQRQQQEQEQYHRDTTATQRRGQDMSSATQRRGQNMVDARSRDANAASLSKPFEVTGEDGTSRVLVQQDKQGNLKPVTGYSPKGVGGPLKLTEVQANATSFVSRMRDSTGTIQQIEDNVGRIDTEAAKSTWTNWLSSPKAQMYQQARRNWVTANLRKESGAAIPESELENEYKKWFPTIGDSKENIALKRQARQVAEEAMTVQAGPGAAQVGGILERGGSPAFKAPDGWKIEKVQ